jgi:hypothetical protein
MFGWLAGGCGRSGLLAQAAAQQRYAASVAFANQLYYARQANKTQV